MGASILLECRVELPVNISWYWTRDPCKAGVNGTVISTANYSDSYTLLPNLSNLSFTVSESTVGYYWCATNITPGPVLQPNNNSLLNKRMLNTLHPTQNSSTLGSCLPPTSACYLVGPPQTHMRYHCYKYMYNTYAVCRGVLYMWTIGLNVTTPWWKPMGSFKTVPFPYMYM